MLESAIENLTVLKQIADYEREIIKNKTLSIDEIEGKLEVIKTLDEIIIPKEPVDDDILKILNTLHRDIIQCLEREQLLVFLEKESIDKMYQLIRKGSV